MGIPGLPPPPPPSLHQPRNLPPHSLPTPPFTKPPQLNEINSTKMIEREIDMKIKYII